MLHSYRENQFVFCSIFMFNQLYFTVKLFGKIFNDNAAQIHFNLFRIFNTHTIILKCQLSSIFVKLEYFLALP